MATSRSQEIRVGVVMVLALAVLLGGIIWGKGGGGFGIGSDERIIQMSFPTAPGIDVGAPITLKGVRKGSVTAMEVLPDEVRITAKVESKVPLHSDAVAYLQMLEVTGGKKIELIPGSASDLLPSNAVIPGTVQGDFSMMLADVDEISGRARAILGRVDSVMMVVNDVVGSREFRRNLENTLSNLHETSDAARQIALGNRETINRTIANLDRAAAELRSLVDDTRPVVDRTLTVAEGAAHDAQRLIGHVDSTLYGVDTLIARLDSLVVDVRGGDGLASKLLYDEKFAAELDATLLAVQSLIKSIEQQGLKTRINIGFGK